MDSSVPGCERVTICPLNLDWNRLGPDAGERPLLALLSCHGRVLFEKGADCIVEVIVS